MFFGIFLFYQPGEPIAQSSPIPNYTSYQNGNGNYASNDPNQSTDPETNDGLERSRSRKKRDFFGTLKRRLGRSKSRAKSLERQGAVPIDANNPTGKINVIFCIAFCSQFTALLILFNLNGTSIRLSYSPIAGQYHFDSTKCLTVNIIVNCRFKYIG